MSQLDLLVLAGGFGTRLRSAVSEVPKPLAPVAGQPYLRYMIESWREQGIRSMIFLLHHQAEQIEAFLEALKKEKQFADCEFRTVTEPEPLGTGGAVAYAVQRAGLTGSFLVTNADTWLGAGIKQLAEASAPAMAVVEVNDSGRYGSVEIDRDTVTAFNEKQHKDGRSSWINAGLYHLHADFFRGWDGKAFSLERELFPELVKMGALKAARLDAEFIDIGIPEDYYRFCNWIELGKVGVL